MEPRHKHETEPCKGISEILARVGDKWTILVIGELRDGAVRFNELRRRVGGVSQRMLTLTLRGLERDGLVGRTVFATIPPRVDYELTELGRELLEPVIALAQWSVRRQGDIRAARQRFDARAAQAEGSTDDGAGSRLAAE